jgi:quaternary ammonium compound-resistance protein SugE
MTIFSAVGKPSSHCVFTGQLGFTLGQFMAWLQLFAAGILEIIFAYAIKESDGFSKLLPSLMTLLTVIGSFWLLSSAMRTIPMGTAYTVWTGIGGVGAFIVGITVLSEPITVLRLLAATLIISGLILMKVGGS